MAYLPLRNYKYDSGPHRIQSGPDHEGYIVITQGVQSTGADNGIIVDGTPLSGVVGSGQRWGYDANWRYVPTSAPSLSGRLTPTLRQPSGTLGSYTFTRISTPTNVAGVKVVSSVESDTTFKNLRKRKSVYYGGACPDNQNYSPFNTPEGNTAAEGKTGGGVTHPLYESPLLTNVLGGQGTSDRSEWQYSSPVYCAVFTEAKRSETPGVMSGVIRSTYRGGSLSYLTNYGNVVLGGRQFSGGGGGGGDDLYEEEIDGGFGEWVEEDFSTCTPYTPELPSNNNEYPNPATVYVGDILTANFLTGEINGALFCEDSSIEWYSDRDGYLGSGETYLVPAANIGSSIYYEVTYENDEILPSPLTDPVAYPLPFPPCAITDIRAIAVRPSNVAAWPVGTYDPCGRNEMQFEAFGTKFNPDSCARESFYSVIGFPVIDIGVGQVVWPALPVLDNDLCENYTIQTYEVTRVYLSNLIGSVTGAFLFLRTQRGLDGYVTWTAAIRPMNPSGLYVRPFPQPGETVYGEAPFIPSVSG